MSVVLGDPGPRGRGWNVASFPPHSYLLPPGLWAQSPEQTRKLGAPADSQVSCVGQSVGPAWAVLPKEEKSAESGEEGGAGGGEEEREERWLRGQGEGAVGGEVKWGKGEGGGRSEGVKGRGEVGSCGCLGSICCSTPGHTRYAAPYRDSKAQFSSWSRDQWLLPGQA